MTNTRSYVFVWVYVYEKHLCSYMKMYEQSVSFFYRVGYNLRGKNCVAVRYSFDLLRNDVREAFLIFIVLVDSCLLWLQCGQDSDTFVT